MANPNRSNKASRDKLSIMVDAKHILQTLQEAWPNIPKFERADGAPAIMRRACYDLIAHLTVGLECPEVRLEHIYLMLAAYSRILTSFELCQHLLSDRHKLEVAERLERIQEGAARWRSASRSMKGHVHEEFTD